MMKNISRDDLKEMLCENIPDISNKRVWIWGAGNTAQLHQEGFRRLREEGFHIEGYIDKTVSKSQELFNGKPVIAPENIENIDNICILICTISPNIIKEIQEHCKSLNIECFVLGEVILKTHYTEVLECYDLLDDQLSKDVYAELVRAWISGDNPNPDIMQNNCYFALEPFIRENPDEVFVDCGAYVGDTVEDFMKRRNGKTKKIIAFEPDALNFRRLKEQVEKECKKWNVTQDMFELYPYGIGEKQGLGNFERYEDNNGIGSKMVSSESNEEGNCRIVALDSFLKEPYSFLKADIESYEYQMILGAKKGIIRYEPLLAICIYHNVVDFYSIPILVKQILPKYHIAIRYHGKDLSEIIMYAWV